MTQRVYRYTYAVILLIRNSSLPWNQTFDELGRIGRTEEPERPGACPNQEESVTD